MSQSSTNVTLLLARIAQGDKPAFGRLLPLLYKELRGRAAAHMRGERKGHTLQPTALVHEAYLRLVDQNAADWKSRSHFFAVAARAMRRVLVDHARARNAAKRHGKRERITLNEELTPGKTEVDVVELNEALAKLEAHNARMARVVELRFFAGLSVEEAADALQVDPRTVKRDWKVARTLLYDSLQGRESGGGRS